ncbi:TraR/DksA family transcriptional regulator [Prolixibacter denitrificans]|jgi:DnaK suppressor protein|uniref:DksA/traR C4-type zinc finger family protein n=2 Tax=Prolixibacter denitrificans TaxID=1541063 RepID=A0ABQ0ZPS0_9BACT|nr:TraR/DksA C4-type zinc finger protein [Prolixibacter denitrificans]GET23408.1 dksA/traR C4-type zinc finger family protein [Prolixibacter denitrificans]
MTKEDREKLRETMTTKVAGLKEELLDLKELTRPEAPDCAIGRVSRMDAINNRSVNEAAMRNKQLKLSKLEEALEKIDSPDFGKCTRCGEEIPWGRIAIMPESTLCIRCASR